MFTITRTKTRRVTIREMTDNDNTTMITTKETQSINKKDANKYKNSNEGTKNQKGTIFTYSQYPCDVNNQPVLSL
jgi:hypothetical protein